MRLTILALLSFALLGLNSCDVDQTEEGEMPDVDVSVEEGDMPEYDVDWADVDVTTETRMVEVPKVVVVTEEEQVEVPVVNVNMEERTLMVEAEVSGTSHEIDIEGVYASRNRLFVVSELEPTGEDLGNQKMRVSDRIVLNAPDLDVKHYIIGEKPDRTFNDNYNYVPNINEISGKLKNGKTIYSA